jgi:hypothetical protein
MTSENLTIHSTMTLRGVDRDGREPDPDQEHHREQAANQPRCGPSHS